MLQTDPDKEIKLKFINPHKQFYNNLMKVLESSNIEGVNDALIEELKSRRNSIVYDEAKKEYQQYQEEQALKKQEKREREYLRLEEKSPLEVEEICNELSGKMQINADDKKIITELIKKNKILYINILRWVEKGNSEDADHIEAIRKYKSCYKEKVFDKAKNDFLEYKKKTAEEKKKRQQQEYDDDLFSSNINIKI